MKRKHGGIRGEHPRGLADFSSNLNPWGPPEAVRRLFSGGLVPEIVPYPDPGYPALREALGFYAGCPPECVYPANGSEEIFFWICRLLSPRVALTINPTYCEYAVAASAAGAEVRELVLKAEEGFVLRPEEAGARVREADLVFVCNPNNPTGNLLSREVVRELERSLKPGAVLVVDEAFMDFVEAGKDHTSVPLVGEGLWVTRSLTKFFSLAGLRLGYLVAPAGAVEALEAVTPLWRVNVLAETAALTALADGVFLREMPERIAVERERFAEELRATGVLHPRPSAANFLLVEVEASGPGARELESKLIKRGYLIRDASDFPGLNERFIRLAVLDRERNESLVHEIKRIIDNV